MTTPVPGADLTAGLSTDRPSSNEAPAPTTAPAKKPVRRDPNQNHGRYGGADYPGCINVTLSCGDELQAGAPCPDCQEGGLSGKLYAVEAGVLIRLQGNPLISGTQYTIEKLRCALCGKHYSADVPPEIANRPKYDVSCLTNIALGRYYFGLPFKRLEHWQRLLGIPLSDATQWDKIGELMKMLKPVYRCLLSLAPEGQTVFYDDTPNRILALPDTQATRKGVYTTAMISQLGPHAIYLFCTSGRYASENVVPLLSGREDPALFLTMSDASAMNIPRVDELNEALLARWILSFCLVHGRRKFWEISAMFEPECDFVLEQISQVYQHEKICRQQRMTDLQRLAYHQAHSAPLLQALHSWLTNKLQFYEVEPNSGLGQAMQYMLKHWEALTRFLHVPGAPLDNSLCERAIKVVLRHRKNSLFFKTLFGAEVGDCLMSVIYTAAMGQVNVFEYLNALQRHHREVAQEPEAWLPWHYQTVGLRAAA